MLLSESIAMSDRIIVGDSGLIGLAYWSIYLFLYLFYSYAQYKLSNKLEIKYGWMAWVPVLGIFNLVKIAWLSFLWILGLFIPLWNIYVIIKIYHWVSKRTGHGGWWTFWLIFTGWLFLPVTAFHYEKWDEINPRPFAGWKKFLLVLISLGLPLILLITIFAAVFNSYQRAYFDRFRDTIRMSAIKDFQSILWGYYSDTETFPSTPASGCIPYDLLKSRWYMYGSWFTDPIPGRLTEWCDGTDWQTYAYRWWTRVDGTPYHVIGVEMQTAAAGNSSLPIDSITPETIFSKWSGKFYYLVR